MSCSLLAAYRGTHDCRLQPWLEQCSTQKLPANAQAILIVFVYKVTKRLPLLDWILHQHKKMFACWTAVQVWSTVKSCRALTRILEFCQDFGVCEAATGSYAARAGQDLTCGPGKLPFSFSTAEELSAHTGLTCMQHMNLETGLLK